MSKAEAAGDQKDKRAAEIKKGTRRSKKEGRTKEAGGRGSEGKSSGSQDYKERRSEENSWSGWTKERGITEEGFWKSSRKERRHPNGTPEWMKASLWLISLKQSSYSHKQSHCSNTFQNLKIKDLLIENLAKILNYVYSTDMSIFIFSI